MTAHSSIRIRPARPSDETFLVALIPRLRAFGPGPLRSPEAMDRAEQDAVRRALADASPDTVLFVAELTGADPLGTESPRPAGLALGESHTDYFTGERHGHLGILAVSEEAEGQGVGQALLAATESWARERGYRFLTLNVFDGNHRARSIYAKAGFRPDAIKYLKELG
ncbi:MAG: GNAT family N-acetyltransferase [Gemmatimonadota bacterium]